MQTLELIAKKFPISNEEFEQLDKSYGKLSCYAGWQLKKKNAKNSSTNDPEDDIQELKIAMIRAGTYYKRQTYIEQCFSTLKEHVKDNLIKKLVGSLEDLWKDRRRHGANRQRFGEFHESILDRLVEKHVPTEVAPCRTKPLTIDANFARYCKQIIWNEQRSLGKVITKEKSWRTGLVSLSEHDHLLGVEM